MARTAMWGAMLVVAVLSVMSVAEADGKQYLTPAPAPGRGQAGAAARCYSWGASTQPLATLA